MFKRAGLTEDRLTGLTNNRTYLSGLILKHICIKYLEYCTKSNEYLLPYLF